MTAHELALKIISEQDTLTIKEIEDMIKKYATECIDRYESHRLPDAALGL